MYVPGLDYYKSNEELRSVVLFKGYPEPLLTFVTVCCVVFIIIGIPGNLVTILALSNYKKVRNATAMFIINLSCSDLLFCSIILPLTTGIFLDRHWISGKTLCKMYAILNYGFTAVSVFTIIAITINRYVMVIYPNIYPRMYSQRNIYIMIAAIWIGAFGMLMPIIFEAWGRFSLDPLVGFCTVIPDKNGNTPKILLIIMGFLFPCFFILACYSRIMWVVRRSSKKCTVQSNPADSSSPINEGNQDISTRETSTDSVTSCPEEDDSASSPGFRLFKRTFQTKFTVKATRKKPSKRDKKLQAMIFAIIITFFVCHLPIMIAKIASSDFTKNPYGNITGYILLYMTTCSNPVIYVVLSNEYRQAYKHLFKKIFALIR